MAKSAFDVLREKIDVDIASLTNAVLTGAPENYSTYLQLVGRFSACERIKRYIDDLEKSMEEGSLDE